MIVTKNDGTKIIKVDIVIFKSNEVEVWVNGAKTSILIPISNVSTIS